MIDDLIGAERGDRAWQAFKYLGVVLEDLGLVEKQSKEVFPRQLMDCLGVMFDLIHFTMSVTPERFTEIKQLVNNWLINTKATNRKLESLIGKQLFVAKCVASGRLFVGRLLDVLRGLHGHYPIFVVETEMQKDIRWWATFLERYNGVSMIPDVI